MRNRVALMRRVAIGLGAVFLLAAAAGYSFGAAQSLLIYLGIAGVLIVGSALSIKDTKRRTPDDRGYWEMTGERFRDPATGHTMEVRHNPVTGERDYVDLDPESS